VHADSAYALGLLGKGWKAKANQEIVERMRGLDKNFKDLRLVKVAGHAGVAENERADELARTAITRRK
jgi:ribonuclease HI